MSDSQAYEEITVASDGIAVTKRFEADEFPVPAIAFNVVSRRTEPVTLRMVDTVPEDVAVEDLGFHPEYGSEFWDINDDQITFEKEIEAEADYTTVYGIRATGTDDVEKFLTEPTVENVDPPLSEDEDSLVGSSDNAVKDVISGDSDSVPGLEENGDEDIETLNLKDPNSDGEVAEAEEGGGEVPEDGAPATGNVVAAMANEIRQNNVSAADVKLLKRALDAVSEDSDPDGGVNTARLNRIQGDIADLRAYTDALEQFLNENGTGDEVIEEFESRLGQFESRLNSLQGELNGFEEELDATTATVDAVNGQVEELDGDVDEMETELEDVETTVESMEGELSSLETEIEDVREELGEGEIDERLSSLEDDIIELKEWREQLSSVIG